MQNLRWGFTRGDFKGTIPFGRLSPLLYTLGSIQESNYSWLRKLDFAGVDDRCKNMLTGSTNPGLIALRNFWDGNFHFE
jgi:hypothetical protein